ncbi:MAG: transcriptional regulator [Pimelobacter sp.]|nr:transcriptional regulator [Pimelobacter sp.]
MAGDRPGNGGPGEGAPFGWLYGKGRDDEQPHDGAEPTERIPVQPRPDDHRPPEPTAVRPAVTPPRSPAPPSRPSPPPAPAPTPAPGRSGGGSWSRRLRRPRFYIRTVLLLVLLFVVYTVAVPFVTWSSSDQVAFEPDGNRPAEQDGTTYLLVGSDSRADLSAEERKRLTTGNPSSELTDTIMLLHTGDGPNVLLSIPRDTVTDPGQYGVSKINAAYARGGVPLLTQIIEDETGIRIDKYVEIGLGGVADVVDAVGGIEVNAKERLNDKFAGINIKKGRQTLDGAQALGYSRSRKFSQFGDLERVRRQREVVAAIGDKVLSPWTVLNPVRWWRLNQAVPRFFVFGEGTSKLDASRWALNMSRVQLTCTMPVTDTTANFWDLDRAGPLFEAIIDDRTDDITKKQCTGNGIAR